MPKYHAKYRLPGPIIADVTVEADSEMQAREKLVNAMRTMASQGPERIREDETGMRSGNTKHD